VVTTARRAGADFAATIRRMPNSSSKIFAGFFVCSLVFGLLVCGVGITTALTIKSDKVDCMPAYTAGDNEAFKPTTNGVAVCIAASEAAIQANVTRQSTLAFGLILGGVAIMISGIGFSVMGRSTGLPQLAGPRPPMPPQQPYGQSPVPSQPRPFPPPAQERPQS
jgi:hypothetical protein